MVREMSGPPFSEVDYQQKFESEWAKKREVVHKLRHLYLEWVALDQEGPATPLAREFAKQRMNELRQKAEELTQPNQARAVGVPDKQALEALQYLDADYINGEVLIERDGDDRSRCYDIAKYEAQLEQVDNPAKTIWFTEKYGFGPESLIETRFTSELSKGDG